MANPHAFGGHADSSASPSSLIRVLHRDALESIFSFSDLVQLHSIMRVCKEWTAVVASMAPITGGELTEQSQLDALMLLASDSPLARHITSLASDVELDSESMPLDELTRLLPSLTALHYSIVAIPPAPMVISFPPSLTHLNLSLLSSSDPPLDFTPVIESVGRLTALVELTLSQWLHPSGAPVVVRFTPLIGLHHLRSLEIGLGGADSTLTEEQIDDLRAMRQLHSLRVDGLNEALGRLLRPDESDGIGIDDHLPPFQWRTIHPTSSGWLLTDESLALLPLLPSLTSLDAWLIGARVDALARMTRLSTLALRCRMSHSATAESLLPGLQACGKLTNLSLSSCPFTANDFDALLTRMPLLGRLELTSASVLESLRFFAAQPTLSCVRSLTCLELRQCTRIPAADVSMLYGLRALESLELDRSFDAPLSDDVLRMLEPPSALMPALESFEYQPPSPN